MSEWDQIERANAARQRRYWQDKADTTGQDTSAHVNYWNQFINEIDKGEGWQDRVAELANTYWNQTAEQEARQQIPQIRQAVEIEKPKETKPTGFTLENLSNVIFGNKKNDEEEESSDTSSDLNPSFQRTIDREMERRGLKSNDNQAPTFNGSNGSEPEVREEMGKQILGEDTWNRYHNQPKYYEDHYIGEASPMNKTYEDYFASQGLDLSANNDHVLENLGKWFRTTGIGTAMAYAPDVETMNMYQDVLQEGNQAFKDALVENAKSQIDDGTMDVRNLTSDRITGKQVKVYADLTGTGPTGDDYDLIDDNAIYSKMDLAEKYGLVPYVPDMAAYQKMHGQKLMDMPGEIANEVSNFRTNTAQDSYVINGKKAMGKDLRSDKVDLWGRRLQNEMANPDSTIYDPNADHTGSVGYAANRYEITLDNGEVLELEGQMRLIQQPTGYVDSDGNQVWTSPAVVQIGEDTLKLTEPSDWEKIHAVDYGVAEEGVEPSMYLPNYTMDDGTEFTYDEMMRLLRNDGDDPDIKSDFGALNWWKPSYMIGDFLPSEEKKGMGLDDLVPKMFDITASSAPYFTPWTSIPVGLSRAQMAMNNIDPYSTMLVSNDKTYKAIDDTDDADKYLSGIVGNAAMPLTELGFGRIGGNAFKKIIPALQRKFGIADHAWMPAAQWGIGTLGEGVEELGGNVVEEFADQGVQDWYGNLILDDNGNPIKNSDGSYKKDPNTSAEDRWRNYLADAPEAFMGGLALGGMFGLPEIPGTIRSTSDIYNRNKEAGTYGHKDSYDGARSLDEIEQATRRYLGLE